MLVRVEKMAPIAQRPMTVRVHSPLGHAEVLWCGEPEEADGRHHVEWSVDEDIRWGDNTRSSALAEPAFWQEGDQIVLRGRLHLTDGAAALEMGDSQVLFDLAAPPPESIDRAWVEISAGADRVALWPYRL